MIAILTPADLPDDSSLPIYQRIKDAIQSKIDNGSWPPGTQIPSENQLAADLNVSRMTINRPFRELAAAGILKRVHGLGTFVAEPPRHASLIELRSIAEEIAAQGKTHRAEILLLEETEADADIAERFTLPPGEQLFHIIVIHFQDEIPIQLEDRYVHPTLVPDFMQVDFTQVTPTDYLVSQIVPDEIEHIVQAILPDALLVEQLSIAANEPCLRLQRRTWKHGQVVTNAYMTYPSSRYDLGARYSPNQRKSS
ncbi:MAG: histidine utilization repressor [Thiolinea sp.]